MHTKLAYCKFILSLGSGNLTVETLFYFCLSFSRLKCQMKLNLTSEFITLTAFFGGPDIYHADFSPQAGDFHFKLVASFKILVAMATKMVTTWRVGNI